VRRLMNELERMGTGDPWEKGGIGVITLGEK
jgi:hypothetical protein